MIFVAGCVGASSPEILRLYKIRNRKLKFRKSYYVISVIFFLLGGFVALILPAVSLWGAFYAGLALPIIISGTLGKPVQKKFSRTLRFPVEEKLSMRNYLWCIFSLY